MGISKLLKKIFTNTQDEDEYKGKICAPQEKARATKKHKHNKYVGTIKIDSTIENTLEEPSENRRIRINIER